MEIATVDVLGNKGQMHWNLGSTRASDNGISRYLMGCVGDPMDQSQESFGISTDRRPVGYRDLGSHLWDREMEVRALI